MYYCLYQTIKQRLADAFGLTLDAETGEVADASESELKEIRWFNEPYETGGLPGMATVLVECTPVDLSAETKSARNRPLTIRLHVVSQMGGGAEGKVRDSDLKVHEGMVQRVVDCLQQQRLPFDGHETRPLRPVSWTPQPKYPGYLMTWIEFRTKG